MASALTKSTVKCTLKGLQQIITFRQYWPKHCYFKYLIKYALQFLVKILDTLVGAKKTLLKSCQC